MQPIREILVTGGAGYVGAVLVPRLLERGFGVPGLLKHGYGVRVLDRFFFGDKVLQHVAGNPNLQQIKGDLRDQAVLRRVIPRCDAVIHLACISNDPSFELNPDLGRSINYDAFGPLVKISKDSGVHRFLYASSSSVYGVSDEANVTEEHPLRPLTDYSKYKALCEPILLAEQSPEFTTVIVRPATVCGYSTRQRLDLTVNILTNHAVNLGKITVFGGDQLRPNIHIDDLVDLYLLLLEAPAAKVAGKVFNAGYQNQTVAYIAERVRGGGGAAAPGRERAGDGRTPSADHRSYHISSAKIRRVLGFEPQRSIEDAARDLVWAFRCGKLPGAMTDPRYSNIKTMQR